MKQPCPECGYVREERAAIHEFEGGASRAQAEEMAKGEMCCQCGTGNAERGIQHPALRIEVVGWEKDRPQKGEYVGGGRTLAGPYRFGFDGSREVVVRLYREWLWAEIKGGTMVVGKLRSLLAQARTKEGLVLVCLEPEIGAVLKGALEWLAAAEGRAG